MLCLGLIAAVVATSSILLLLHLAAMKQKLGLMLYSHSPRSLLHARTAALQQTSHAFNGVLKSVIRAVKADAVYSRSLHVSHSRCM